MRLVKWIGGILAVLAVAGLAAFFLIPAERIAGLAAQRFEAATGRSLSLGEVRPSLFPLGVTASDIEIANAGWSDRGAMLRAGRVRVSVALASVFRGAPHVTGIEVVDPAILLERNAKGQANWDFGGDGGGGASGGGAGFTLDRLTVTGGRITYADPGRKILVEDLFLETSLPGADAPTEVELSAKMGGTAFKASADLARSGALTGGGASDITATLALGGARADFAGRIDLGGADLLAGDLDFDAPKLAQVMAALGQADFAMPAGFGPGASAKGALAVSGERIALSDAAIALGGLNLSGRAAVALSGDLPHVTAALHTPLLDLNPMLGGDDGGEDGWSRDPISLSGLDGFTAEADLTADRILYGDSTFADAAMEATVADARLVLVVNRMQAYGGSVTGRIAAREGVALQARLAARDVALQSFMRDFFDFDRIRGTGNVNASVSGTGGSVHALMNALDGEGDIRFTRGELLGFDLVGMLRNLDAAYVGKGASTIFDSITATFRINGGVVTNVDLSFLAPLVEAVGEGTIGLGERVMNYRITPKLLKGEGTGVSVPVLITGPWSNLKFRPDLEGLINLKAGDAVKAVQEQVQKKAGEAVKKVEEDVRKKVEDEIRKGLGGLLGGSGGGN